MASNKCYASNASPPSASPRSMGGGADRLVMTEIEAAETLADLAHLAMRERDTASDCSGDRWWSKGKRGRRRFTGDSPIPDSASHLSASGGPTVGGDQPHERILAIESVEPARTQQDVSSQQVKVEQDADLPKTSPGCSTSYSLVDCNKLRRNLTEEEKEARRIRRVLANRESARQTIRRRQALCEELTNKAANLALENENLKREKELALKEYQSLETTNKLLKEQMAKSTSTKAEKSSVQCESSVAEISTSSRNCPWFLYNHFPVTQLMWPSISQPSNLVQSQHGPHSSIVIPSNAAVPCSYGANSSHELNTPINDNRMPNSLYMLPCSWFFPLSDFGNGQHPPSVDPKDKQEGHPVDRQCTTSASLNTEANVDNPVALSIELKTESTGLTEARTICDPNDATPRLPLGGDEHGTGTHIIQRLHRPSSLDLVGHASTRKCENGLQSHSAPNTKVSSTASHISSSFLEKKQDHVTCPGQNLVNTAAAAEARKRRKELKRLKSNGHCPGKNLVETTAADARKRRKELTKLKSIHAHQRRMHC